jgi:hypothetical protein
MSSSYDIISYQPEFKDQVIQLQTELWSPSLALNRAYFEWKHECNPYMAGPLVYLALHKLKVVGMRGFFGVRWEKGSDQTLTGLYADDMVIAQDHRKQGLVRRIMEAAFKDLLDQGHTWLFNLSAGPVTFMSSLAMGWQSAGSMQPMTRQFWRLTAGRRMFHAARILSAGLLSSDRISPPLAHFEPSLIMGRLHRDIPSVSYGVVARTDEMAELVARVGSDGRIRHVRDAT